MDLWTTRTEALKYLDSTHPARVGVLNQIFALLDRCIDAFEEGAEGDSSYGRVCGLTTLKAKHLAQGSYSLILDGLGQEAGALLRPTIEYVELLTYFRHFPESVEHALTDRLPKAGARAKAVEGMCKEFREYLNSHASHSSFSQYAMSHLMEPETARFKKQQQFAPSVLDRNLRDLAVQLILLLREATLAQERLNSKHFLQIAMDADALKEQFIEVFALNES